MDLREYACPEDLLPERVLAYVSVTQMPCPSVANAMREVLVRVDTRTFDRATVVAQLTNCSQHTTSSLALLFDYTGEGGSVLNCDRLVGLVVNPFSPMRFVGIQSSPTVT